MVGRILHALHRIEMVDDARYLWRRWSTRIAGIQFAAVIGWWAALPEEWKDAVPHWLVLALVAGSGISFIGAQSVKQKNLHPPKEDAP
jgi:hypothetical protein